MNRLRKGIASFLLILVVFPLMSVVLFHIQQRNIRALVKKAFKEQQLSTVRVRQLNWYKPDKEILVDGILFDVSTIEQQADGSYVVTGLFDHQEQELHKQMDAATHSQKALPLTLASAFCFANGESYQSITPAYQLISIEWGSFRKDISPQFEPGIIYQPPKLLSHC